MKRAIDIGKITCMVCHSLNDEICEQCYKCHSKLKKRSMQSLHTTLAMTVLAWILYIPANIFPIMTTTTLGKAEDSTIVGGVVLFFQLGSYFVSSVIFIASVIIPIAKMIAIMWLVYCTYSPKEVDKNQLTKLYRMTEFIGKWSMIDVFVVTILVALIQLDGLMTIQPGMASTAFSLVVIFTMIAAHSFDTRLLWDKVKE